MSIKNGVTPTIRRITATLQERIDSGVYAENQWLPTERELAEEFLVSRATIRSALAELEKRNLVFRAAGCRPLVKRAVPSYHREAKEARCSLGLWVSGDIADAGGVHTVRGINGVLDLDAFRLVVEHHRGHTLEALIESEARALTRFARDSDIAGLILWYFGGQQNRPVLEALRATNIPMVFVDRRPPEGFEADYIGIRNERAAQQIVTHLLEQGHRRIAHITNEESASTVAERLAGYRQALEAARIPYAPELVLTARFMGLEGIHTGISDTTLVDRLLTMPDPPTAVFVVNDSTALRLLVALRARGVRVPEDIAVAGFDDDERWKPGIPFLTTIRQPFEEMGTEAARLLLERLKTGATNTYRHILLDAPLVARSSTSLPRKSPDGFGTERHSPKEAVS